MQKRLTFNGAKPSDRLLYETLWDAVILGGSRGVVKTRSEIRKWAKIERALKTIGVETRDYDPRFRPDKPLTLRGVEIVEVTFDVGDIDEIEKRIECVPWSGNQEIAVADLLDFLSAAPVVEEKA